MELFSILGTAVGLAMDAFAVAMAASVSLGNVTRRQVFRFAFHFGLFQAMMPTIGWLAGWGLRRTSEGQGFDIMHWDHWIAFALLAAIGGKAVIEAIRGGDEQKAKGDPTRGWSLVALSVATSIDALAVGFSFAMLRISIWYPAAIIGVVTAGLTSLGMLVGGRLGSRFGRPMEVIGGLVLIGIGIKIVVERWN